MEYYFEAKKMSVGYQGRPLISDIEISLKKGQILTLIGPNGVGKSTVLKSIARQLSLIGGVIFLDGQSLQKMSGGELSRKMAVMFTEKLKAELMTCEDVVATGRYPYTGRFGLLSETDRQVVRKAMELIRIMDIKDRDFTQVSDGQRQRVMLARAVCQEPEIIILDEPTSYLDVRYKLEFLSLLQQMCREKGLTVIMSLHELELAERISDKVLCLDGKYVDRFGTPEEIFKAGYLRHLFHISSGSFDEENGNMELEAPKGKADIFVIAGGGSGRMVYRRLQRQDRAFFTGILFDNDLDYPVAKALAQNVFAAGAFEAVEEALLKEAKKQIDACRTVICCRERFGSFEAANRELAEYAVQTGKELIMAYEEKS
ncbi:MAG: ABC transporter ATP-binding protein [Lachnospiraceae bacterium]|nr:ABC transporter ATP-binding protein [Lachnospiraceae bacterium]